MIYFFGKKGKKVENHEFAGKIIEVWDHWGDVTNAQTVNINLKRAYQSVIGLVLTVEGG